MKQLESFQKMRQAECNHHEKEIVYSEREYEYENMTPIRRRLLVSLCDDDRDGAVRVI